MPGREDGVIDLLLAPRLDDDPPQAGNLETLDAVDRGEDVRRILRRGIADQQAQSPLLCQDSDLAPERAVPSPLEIIDVMEHLAIDAQRVPAGAAVQLGTGNELVPQFDRSGIPYQDVVSIPPVEFVGTGTAVEIIVAGPAEEPVGSAPPVKAVAACPSPKDIVAGAPPEIVPAAPPVQHVRSGQPPDDVVACQSVEYVVPRRSNQNVRTVRSILPHRRLPFCFFLAWLRRPMAAKKQGYDQIYKSGIAVPCSCKHETSTLSLEIARLRPI